MATRSGVRDAECIWDWNLVCAGSVYSQSDQYRWTFQLEAWPSRLAQGPREVKSWKHSIRCCPDQSNSDCNKAEPSKLRKCCLLTAPSCNSQVCWSSDKSPHLRAHPRRPCHRVLPQREWKLWTTDALRWLYWAASLGVKLVDWHRIMIAAVANQSKRNAVTHSGIVATLQNHT